MGDEHRDWVERPDTAWPGYILDQSGFDVLPCVPARWLEQTLPRFSEQDIDLVLRHKLVPLRWSRTRVTYAAISRQSWRMALQQGLTVTARMLPDDYHAAIFRSQGRRLLADAVGWLAHHAPSYSARQRFSVMQGLGLCVFVLTVAAGIWTVGSDLSLALISMLASLFFLAVVFLRFWCLFEDEDQPAQTMQGDNRQEDAHLPVYSVLVPLHREVAVLPGLLQALLAIDYPAEKLDIKIILEQSDHDMHRAIAMFNLPDHCDVIIVPKGAPQTKPRALNYALSFARGELVTIYDGEDIPDPSQLRIAAAQFKRLPRHVACLQAALAFHNADDNWLSRQFAAEYAGLFRVLLPALARRGLPLPLGGTSNHFCHDALIEVGAWDPFNVTEDADLGLRLARFGFATGVLPSTTLEEANIELWNWIKQRRRWLKGFLHTWLVHMRKPLKLWRQLGTSGFLAAQVMTGGVFVSTLFHPFFLAHGLWCLTPEKLQEAATDPLSSVLAVFNVALLVLGYGSSIAMASLGLKRQALPRNLTTLLSIPAYWMLMSVAAWMALWDFAIRPHHWHKTAHGLSARKHLGKPAKQKRAKSARAVYRRNVDSVAQV